MTPILECNPFGPGQSYDWMWPCCAGTHASPQWQTNGNDCYAAPGTPVVAPITGRVVRAGVPPIGEGIRVGIQGTAFAVYLAHMEDVRVTEGQPVRAGALLGVIADDLGFPPHLHFSLARGMYEGGTFVDPKPELARTATFMGGRTYHVGSIEHQPVVRDTLYWFEAYPWDPKTDEGYGPRVLGPWVAAGDRDHYLDRLHDAGHIVTAHGAPGRFYVFDWRPGTYGEPYIWSAPTAVERDRAYRKRRAEMHRPYRRFRGRANSVYPVL